MLAERSLIAARNAVPSRLSTVAIPLAHHPRDREENDESNASTIVLSLHAPESC